MLERDFEALLGRSQDRQRYLDIGLGPTAILQRLPAQANGGNHVIEHFAAAGHGVARPQRNLAFAVLIVDEEAVGGGAYFAARAGHDHQPEMRLVAWRRTGIGAIGVTLDAKPGLIRLMRGERPACGPALVRLLWRAALADPEMQLVTIKEIVTAVDQRRRDAVFEFEERHAAPFGRPRRIEARGLGAYAAQVPA